VREENWKEIMKILPAELHRGLTFGNDCWTFSDDPRSIKNGVPLRIAGAPVIVPVYTPPFGRPEYESPADPYPGRINPFVKASDDVIGSLLETFDFALGFYILYNGQLQIWADGGDSFDRQLTASQYPRRFGGLIVSYFTQGPCATSSAGGTSGQSLGDSQATGTRPTFECGSEIEIRSQSKQLDRSRIGVALEMQNGVKYVTVATHATVAQSKKQRSLKKSLAKLFFWRGRGCTQARSRQWCEGIEVYKPGTNIKVSLVCYLSYSRFLTLLVGEFVQIL
jgi:hypothetical protein